MKWIKGARPQSTFANLEAAQLLGLIQSDFAPCHSGTRPAPMTLMHPASVKKLLAQAHGMQTSMMRVLSGASSADLDKSAFLPPAYRTTRFTVGPTAPRRVDTCPTELAVANGPMVRAPPGGLAHGKAASFKPLDCVTYVGLEWWLPPGWTADTMRRTVREGLTAGKVAQQWPRLRALTLFMQEGKEPGGPEEGRGAQRPGAHTSGACSHEAAQQLPPKYPTANSRDVRAMGDSLLKELLHAQPGCFEGCWPASTGALSAVLTAYMKSLFVLTRAAGEAVMDL